MHCENITVQRIVKCKILSPTSIFADNYRYLCNKYSIAHFDWYRYMPFITNMICTEYTNHQYDICKTVTELCELRDGVAYCGVVNKTDIYVLIKTNSYHCAFYSYILILLLSFYILCLYTIVFSVFYFVRSMCE